MSQVASTLFDPLGFGFGKAIFGKDSAILNVDQLYGNKVGGKDSSTPAAPGSTSAPGSEGVITNQEAQALAAQKLFRSGSIYTSTLGDPVTAAQLSGTRLQ